MIELSPSDGKELTPNDELAKAIAEATSPDAIRQLVENAVIAEAALKQSTAVTADAEKLAAEKKIADDAAAAAATTAAAEAAAKAAEGTAPVLIKRIENIGGQDFEFEGASEAEIDRAIVNAYKIAYAVKPETKETNPTVDPAVAAAAAAKAEADDAVAKADLELKFKRGEITTADYLEQSGAVESYFKSKGLSVDELKSTIEKSRNNEVTQSWADATTEFFNTPEGKTWPGGENNKQMLVMKLAELNLTEATDKVDAIRQAYASMKSTNMIFKNEVVDPAAAAKIIADNAALKATADAAAATAAATAAKTVVEPTAEEKLAAARALVAAAELAAKKAPTSSSLFGASSGTGDSGATAAAAEAAAKRQVTNADIPKDASPAEILAAWNAAQIAEGKNPNDAFTSQFAARK
jgi:hypothetical protein